jgi:hypothetical protein
MLNKNQIKMKKSIAFSVLLVAAVGFSGCMKDNYNCNCDPEIRPDHIPPVVFQYEYYNYAWGYRHHGFLIDSDGHILGFSQPKKWITPDSTGMMSKADLEYNLDQTDTLCGKVSVDKLDREFSKIKDIRHGEIVDNGLAMADAGTGTLSAWYWNDKARKYKSVFLISNGDLDKVNTHPDVKELVNWLKKIGEKTNRFRWYGGR